MRSELPPLRIVPVGKNPEATLLPLSEDGEFDDATIQQAEQAFAWKEDGSTHPVHPRLLSILYGALRHFETPFAWLISGYRKTRITSRHSHGRAADVVLPGVSDRKLAAYFRKQGYVGVGIYPVSGFVHVDVRAQSFFWVDYSAP
ncbi:MAG: DUF882 domain-containing protein [Myxococcales bacterium]|nr:MAG: DUF882 domain-containing protein [Myxococcales bacterium]